MFSGFSPSDYTTPAQVKAAGFLTICADELGSIVEGHDEKKLKFYGGGKWCCRQALHFND